MTAAREPTILDRSNALGRPHESTFAKPWTVDDFLAWERRQAERYEFVGGVIRMMVGGSNAHTIIKGNVVRCAA